MFPNFALLFQKKNAVAFILSTNFIKVFYVFVEVKDIGLMFASRRMKFVNMKINDLNYVPQYATWRGETVRNTNGLTQQVLFERKFNLEIRSRIDPGGRLMDAHINQINAMRLNAQRLGTATRPGISINTPTQAMETFNNRRINAIRQLMSEQEEGSLAFNVLKGMLERAQNPSSNGSYNVRYAERPGGFNVTI